MAEFKKILLPVDSSECATSALKVAVRLAAPLGAELHIVHVVAYPLQLAVGGPIPSSGEVESAARQGGAELLASATELARSRGIPTTSHLLEGQVSSIILQLAKELEVDMIVIGRRGSSRLADLLVGQVTDRAVRLAPCPVLIVREADGGD